MYIVEVTICQWCFDRVRRARERQSFKAKLDVAGNNPVLLCEKLLMQSLTCIKQDLPKLQELLESFGGEHTFENADDVKVHLSNYM